VLDAVERQFHLVIIIVVVVVAVAVVCFDSTLLDAFPSLDLTRRFVVVFVVVVILVFAIILGARRS